MQVTFGTLLLASMLAYAATKEHAVKAGLIYNITKYVVWPSEVNNNEKFNFCVMNRGGLGGSLNALRGKLTNNKPLMLHRGLKGQIASNCHVAFFNGSDTAQMQQVLQRLSHLPVLTVSDYPDFIEQGGMVGLVRDGKRVGFEVNLKAVDAAGLNMGAQLLKLAKRVEVSE